VIVAALGVIIGFIAIVVLLNIVEFRSID